MIKTVNEGFLLFESHTNFEKNNGAAIREYRLDRMLRLLELFGHPETSYRIYHVAGSKGKGSTAACLASILEETGYKTGLYTSPHISNYRERITRNRSFFSETVYLEGMREIESELEKISDDLPGGEEPTTFELLTLLALLIFRNTELSRVVLETGLGGRLDATNTVTPAGVILTPVELEHTEYLGDTLEAIAREKAGIIKQGVPVFTSRQDPRVLSVFRKYAAEKGCAIYHLPEEIKELTNDSGKKSKTGTHWSLQFKEKKRLHLDLPRPGIFQAENAALAALTALKSFTPVPTLNQICKGLEKAALPGRMEEISTHPQVLLDGDHTVNSVTVLAEVIKEEGWNRGILIFGSVKDKDAAGMAQILAPLFREVIVSQPGTFKPSLPEEVSTIFKNCGSSCILEKDPEAALALAQKKALEIKKGIVVTGSFYMVAEIRRLLIQDQPLER